MSPSPLTIGLCGQKTWLPCFFCPTTPCLEHSSHLVDACRIKPWFLWDTSLQLSLPFPWQISAFSSRQPLVHGLKVPGRAFPQDRGTAISQTAWPTPASAGSQGDGELLILQAPWLLYSSCLALVFFGRRKPSATTSSSIYRHICIFVILFTKWQCSPLKKEGKKRSWGLLQSKEAIWYKASRASYDISVYIGEWRTFFLPLLFSPLSSACSISSSDFLAGYHGWKEGQGMGSGYGKSLSMGQENGHGFLAWIHVYRFLSPSDTEVLCGQESSSVGSGFVHQAGYTCT